MDRDTAVFDIYAALRASGYTRMGAIRAMRLVGMTFFEAKRASEAYDAKLAWERTA